MAPDISPFPSTRRQLLCNGGALALAGAGLPARAQAAPLKVGIVYVSTLGAVGWTRQHDLARRAMEQRVSSERRLPSWADCAQDIATEIGKLAAKRV